MEAEKFEHIVERRFEGFESAAPESVWESIDAHLNTKKRRLGILWWGLPVLVLAGLAGMWTLTNRPDGTSRKIEKQRSSTAKQQPANAIELPHEMQQAPETAMLQTPERIHTSNIAEGRTAQVPEVNPGFPNTFEKEPEAPSQLDPERQLPSVDFRNLPVHTMDNYSASDQPVLMKCAAYGGKAPANHSIGVRTSTFVPISKPRLQDGTGEPPGTTLFSDEPMYISYDRPWEAEAYYQRKFIAGYSSISGHLAVAQHNSRYENDSDEWIARGTAIGAGGSFDLFFEWNRFSLQTFAGARWEMQFNKMGGSGVWANYSIADPLMEFQEPIWNKFQRHAFSLEGGIQGNYHLNNRWTLFGQAAYRNYIWEQKHVTYPLVNAPQLLRFGLGVQWKLP